MKHEINLDFYTLFLSIYLFAIIYNNGKENRKIYIGAMVYLGIKYNRCH